MKIRWEKDGTVRLDYSSGSQSIRSIIGSDALEQRIEEFNDLASRLAADPESTALKAEYQDAKDVVQGAYNILHGSALGGLVQQQFELRQAGAAISELNIYAQKAGLSNTQQLRLEIAIAELLEDQGKKLTPTNLDFAIEQLGSAEADAVRQVYGIERTDECFPAETPIDMWPTGPSIKPNADGLYDETLVLSKVWKKPIEDITPEDTVLSYDKDGNLQPGKVVHLYRNTADTLIRLSNEQGGKPFDLVTTPGHVFLDETGGFTKIGDLLRLGGNSARLIDARGEVVTVTGTWLHYCAETAHLFEQAATKSMVVKGNTVYKEEVQEGWKTYNFEVAELHTYIAQGTRVHNDSGILGRIGNDIDAGLDALYCVRRPRSPRSL